MIEKIRDIPGFWLNNGAYNETVLSSRVRIARNIRSVPFPHKLDIDEFNIVKSIAQKFVTNSSFSNSIYLVDLNKCKLTEKRFLRERNYISSEMESSDNTLVILDKKGKFSIQVNDIDHFRIQVLSSGLNLDESYVLADKIDNELNKFAPYAFDDDIGFLTAKPMSCGTGFKFSTILHLPALSIHGRMEDIVLEAIENDIEIKGSENGANTHGYFYQVSCGLLSGFSEIDMLNQLDNIVHKILNYELEERELITKNSKLEIEDLICRANGIMSSARKISYKESIKYLSSIRFGVFLGIIQNLSIIDVDDLLVNLQWAHLRENLEEPFDSVLESDRARANYAREKIKSI